MKPPEAVILCEGYDDRSFWKGWLSDHLGWREARKEGMHGKAPSCYSYRAPSGALVHVLPVQGAPVRNEPEGLDDASYPNQVWREASLKIKRRERAPLSRLVLNVDVDDGAMDSLAASVQTLLGPSAIRREDGDWAFGDGTLVSLVPWHTPGIAIEPSVGVPEKQTLERAVCQAISRAKPAWSRDVHAWLTSRHEPRGADHKAHGWSYIAGWFADHGPGDYYAAVWRDADIASELEKVMNDIGAQRIVEALARLGESDS